MAFGKKIMPSFTRESLNERSKFKPKAWSHQDDLKALIGKRVKLTRVAYTGTTYDYGKLVAADQFTLKLQAPTGHVCVYFKSAFISFEEDFS